MTSEGREGGCQCGGIRYRVEGEPLVVAVCHCTECQRQSGSAFGMSLIVARDAFQVEKGELRMFTRPTDSGGTTDCYFCPDCGTRIVQQPSSMPKTCNIKPGTLDDTTALKPTLQVWLASKQPWTPLAEGLTNFTHNPTQATRSD